MNPATNQYTCSDANGNSASLASSCSYYYMNTYDIENRITATSPGGSGGVFYYSYAPGNKRVWRGNWTGSTPTDEVTFWSISGQKARHVQSDDDHLRNDFHAAVLLYA